MPSAALHEDLRARLGELTLRDEHALLRRLGHARTPEELAALAARVAEAEARVARRRAAVPEVTYPDLPVTARREDLLAALAEHQVVVVAGETGSGKTTQLPKLCLELGRGVRGTIAHTQPRRLAARTVAERIAEELGVGLGEAVGYSVRFTDRTRDDTLVRLMTDGLLLAEVRHDPLLRRYDTIIVDEAHERSLNVDFLLGCLHRILPRRPDLKVVITSATIDPQRFAAHFGGAPVVEVSGRTYPVEVRHRPVAPERDQVDAIGDAVDELAAEGPGDVLVFLSGEREIRDTAEGLRGRLGPDVEVLPLFARLSAAEQHRVFRAHDRRRVVLATNVAETSLTVPGIRYVVDPGTARISRYSARAKVQRLPIEPISQASADQRKGRCGRTADGICVRLYSEQDFAARPRFTDPEVLRTSLAAVILQMAASGLGDVERFPFLDPPDRRQVRDGIALLTELGALDGERLTPLGRRLAALPVDPRFGRMVLEADRLGCADEVIVIAAALSIQDPRERPADRREAADAAHAALADERSDLLSWLTLWDAVGDEQRARSGSAFRRWCRSSFLSWVRVREWQDLVAQLRAAAKGVGVTRNHSPAGPEEVHRALLSGLLSHVGVRDEGRREYLGARGTRFAPWPGSGLARRPPAWVMAAELVETSRLWGRTLAAIDPRWIEPLAEHLVRRSWSEPRWDRRRAEVVATERVTLYGLPVVPGRTRSYGRVDPRLARELFLRHALVEDEWDAPHRFRAANREARARVDALEDRARRHDLFAGDEAVLAFFAARVPADVASGRDFDRWWRDARRADPDLLTLTDDDLLVRGAADALDPRSRPDAWRQGDLVLPLSYRFAPGEADDGVTVHVPLGALGQLRADGFDWLVPAFREELVTALLRGLPKDLRRGLVPIPETAATLVAAVTPRSGPLVDVLAEALGRLRGARVPRDAWRPEALPPHLRMTFQVQDADGAVLDRDDDLEALRERLRPRLQARLADAASALERHGLRAFPEGGIPRTIEIPIPPTPNQAVRAHPALVDEGDAVGVAVLESPAAQEAAMVLGTRRLLGLLLPSPARAAQAALTTTQRLTLAGAATRAGDSGAIVDDAVAAALDLLVARAGGPAWDEAGFARLQAAVGARLEPTAVDVLRRVAAVLGAAREVERRLDGAVPAAFRPAHDDVAAQLDRLVHPGFAAAAGAARLPDLERWLRAAAHRLDRLPDALARDRERQGVLDELEAAYAAHVAALPAGAAAPPALREARWMLEELRAGGAASAKRVRRALAEAAPPR